MHLISKSRLEKVKQLIAERKLDQTFLALTSLFAEHHGLRESIAQLPSYQKVKNRIAPGHDSPHDDEMSLDTLMHNLRQVLEALEQQINNITIIEDSKKVISKSSVSAGGDVHMGDIIHQPIKKEGKELTTLNKVHPDNIIGRTKDLDELQSLLFNNQKVVVVNGLGGIGKTTLSEAYTYKYYNDHQHIAWITHDEDLENDFAQNTNLIKNLGIEVVAGMQPTDIFQEMMRKMRNLEDQPNLLVIDNATKKIESIWDQLPTQPNWHLLVTSREIIENMHVKELDFLSPKEAIELFQKHASHISDTHEIAEIVKAVDYHTLSIEILAKTAKTRRTDSSKLKKALEKNIKAGIKTRHSRGKIDKITSYLRSIFDLSDINDEESWLLKQFSCLPPEFHIWDLLLFFLVEKDEDQEEFNATLSALHEKGWILYNEDTDSYKMHRIIGEVVIHKLQPSVDDVAYLIDQVSNVLSIDEAKDNPIDKFKWVPFGKILTDYFSASSEKQIAILQNNLATVLQALGDYEKAKELFEKAYAILRKRLGDNHPITKKIRGI